MIPFRALLALLACLVIASAIHAAQPLPPGLRNVSPLDLERALAEPFQAGEAIAVFADAQGQPRAGRLPGPTPDEAEEGARRAEHFALARKLNLVTAPRVVPFAPPLNMDQIALLERFAMSDAGAVWFREVADDTLRLFNQGYLEWDTDAWRAYRAGGPRPALSALITGRLSEAGQFAQDVAVFRIHAFEGTGANAAAASIRLGLRGFRCRFPMSDELVDPFAILSHEFGHTRYGDPRSAGLPRGEALTVARYENPVRRRNGFPPRTIYYLAVDPIRPVHTRDPLFNQVLDWRRQPPPSLADLRPVEGLYCECPDTPFGLRDCLATLPSDFPEECGLRWVAVRVAEPD